MKTKIYSLLACSALVALCAAAQTLPKASASPGATAAGPATMPGTQTSAATASASPGAKAARAIPFHGKIGSVDGNAKTFTIAGKEKSRTFKITENTTITKDGQHATIKDVTANEDARGSYWKMPDGSMEVKTLKVGPATDKEKNKTGDGEKKEKAGSSASPSPSASPSASPH